MQARNEKDIYRDISLEIAVRFSREVGRIHRDPGILVVNIGFRNELIVLPLLITGFYLDELLRNSKELVPRLGDVVRMKLYYRGSKPSMVHEAKVKPIAIIYGGPGVLGAKTPCFRMGDIRKLLDVLRVWKWVKESKRPGRSREVLEELGYYSPEIDELIDRLAEVLGIDFLPRKWVERALIAILWSIVHSDVWEDGIVVIARIEDERVLERLDREIEKIENRKESKLAIYRNTYWAEGSESGIFRVISALYVPAKPQHSVLELFPEIDASEAEQPVPRRGYIIRRVDDDTQ